MSMWTQSRVARKVMQVENMVCLAMELCGLTAGRDVVRAVEFCAGSGYIALPLACAVSRTLVSLVDMKKPSLDIGDERVAAAGLGGRATTHLKRVEHFHDPFEVGIALHACGGATDASLEKY